MTEKSRIGCKKKKIKLTCRPTHFYTAFLEKALEEKIKVYCLCPFTTRKTQPLDITIFAPFKRVFKLLWTTFASKRITPQDVIEMSIKAMNIAITPDLTREAWGKVGLDPFDARPLVEERKKGESELWCKLKLRQRSWWEWSDHRLHTSPIVRTVIR